MAMTDIFVSYTSCDRDWAFWIADELKSLGHIKRAVPLRSSICKDAGRRVASSTE
jgi:hypothetical protein